LKRALSVTQATLPGSREAVHFTWMETLGMLLNRPVSLSNVNERTEELKKRFRQMSDCISSNIEIIKELEDCISNDQSEFNQLQLIIQQYDGTVIESMQHVKHWVLDIQQEREALYKKQIQTPVTKTFVDFSIASKLNSSKSTETDVAALDFEFIQRIFLKLIKRSGELEEIQKQNQSDALHAQLQHQLSVNEDIKKLIIHSSVGKHIGKKNSYWSSQEDMHENILLSYNGKLFLN
jgi:hypothetical protein